MGSLQSELQKMQERDAQQGNKPSTKDVQYIDRAVRPQQPDRPGYRTK